jgi:multidrug resistance efflux pump
MKKNFKKMIIFVMLLGIIIVNIGCTGEKTQSVAAASTTLQNQMNSHSTIYAFGVVKANKTKSICINFPAVIDSINVQEGQKVKGGDALITLNMSEYQKKFEAKQLELDSEKKLLALKESRVLKDSDPDLNKLIYDLKIEKALYNKQLKELATKKTLFASGSISKQELNDFKKTVNAQKKVVDDTSYSIDSYKLKDNYQFTNQSDIETSKAKINTLSSELTIMEEKLNRSYLTGSTIICDVGSGLVKNIKFVPGSIIQEGSALLDIVDLDSMVVVADVDESFIKDVELGATARISPLANRTKSYTGHVSRISDMAIVKNGQTFIQVEITVDNNDGFLKLDYNADIILF